MSQVQKSTCLVCGRKFVPYRSTQKYCSDKCRAKAIERFHARKKNEAVERVCPTCGRTFTTTLSHKLYCSNECYLAHKSKEYVKKEGTERICPVCLKVFKTAHPHKKYCSYECYYKAHTARQDKEYIDARTDLPKSN